ncbi:MAG: carbonic anhydrase [Acidimicrobiales bacterium]|nr:carbonic anhydrase [Acidimicrobiales bacterium]
MSNADRFVDKAESYAAGFVPTGLSARPTTGAAVVACMDARIDLFALFGLQIGDAHLLRNAGGTVTDDTLRSLAISQRFLDTHEIVLVHHTGCGMLGFTDEQFASDLEQATGSRPPWAALAFADLADDVRRSIRRIRECIWIPHRDEIRGFVFHVETGRLQEVEV